MVAQLSIELFNIRVSVLRSSEIKIVISNRKVTTYLRVQAKINYMHLGVRCKNNIAYLGVRNKSIQYLRVHLSTTLYLWVKK